MRTLILALVFALSLPFAAHADLIPGGQSVVSARDQQKTKTTKYTVPAKQYRPETVTLGGGKLVKKGVVREHSASATVAAPLSSVVYVAGPNGRRRTLLLDSYVKLLRDANGEVQRDATGGVVNVGEVRVLGVLKGIRTRDNQLRFPLYGVPGPSLELGQAEVRGTIERYQPIAPNRRAEVEAALRAAGWRGDFTFKD